MKFSTIVSGSSGNCVLIQGGSANILVDAGCSLRYLRNALAELHIDESSLSAILITHEHTDHVSGAARISRQLGLPVYATEHTWEKLPFREDFFAWERHVFDYGMEIGNIGLDFFRLSHDAAQPVGFVFEHKGQRIGVATDTGVITPSMNRLLKNVHGLVLEANHDPVMLQQGSYPAFLKRRVISENGHLSNAQAGAALAQFVGDKTRAVILAHLSANNNLPELALSTIKNCLQYSRHYSDVAITIAPRSRVHPLVNIDI